jgi:hypothetical protein
MVLRSMPGGCGPCIGGKPREESRSLPGWPVTAPFASCSLYISHAREACVKQFVTPTLVDFPNGSFDLFVYRPARLARRCRNRDQVLAVEDWMWSSRESAQPCLVELKFPVHIGARAQAESRSGMFVAVTRCPIMWSARTRNATFWAARARPVASHSAMTRAYSSVYPEDARAKYTFH